jgi:DNA-binding response OmpR family regulator
MAAAAATRFDDRKATSQRIILVVEDEVLLRAGTADYLRDSGFMVLEASNATEAMTILSSRRDIDLVFSDVMMPGDMDGFGLARWVHEHHRDIPVLLTSGAGAVVNAPDAFMREPFMRKPYLPEELEQRLRTMLRI